MLRWGSSLGARAWSSVREFFTLRDAERRVARVPAFVRSEVRGEIERAVQLMRAADESSVSLTRSALARQALPQVIIAATAANQFAPDSSRDECPDLDQAIEQLSALPGADEHRSALALLGGSDVLTDRQYRLLANLFAYVERLVELRSPRDLSAQRWLRGSGIVLLTLVGYWLLATPPNLARGSMVSSSSIGDQTPAANLGRPRLDRVVDGVRLENSLALSTNSEVNPWVTVDLGTPRSIQQVVVYPHSNGPWLQADLPQQIRVSLDNEHFEVVAERSRLYTTDFPWRVELPGTRAQYVQVIAAKRKKVSLALNEIEVYGR